MFWERDTMHHSVSAHTHKSSFVQTANLHSDSRPCEMMTTKCKNNALPYHMHWCVCELNNANRMCMCVCVCVSVCVLDLKKRVSIKNNLYCSGWAS